MAWFQRYSLSLDSAGSQRIAGSGHAIIMRRASSSAVEITATVTTERGDDALDLIFGEGWRFGPWSSLRLDWQAQAGETCELIVWGDPAEAAGRTPEIFVSPLLPSEIS